MNATLSALERAQPRDGINSALIGELQEITYLKGVSVRQEKIPSGRSKKSSIVCPSIILTFVLPPFLLLPLYG